MALTVRTDVLAAHFNRDAVDRELAMVFVSMDLDNSYPTGGYAFTLPAGIREVRVALFEPGGGYVYRYDRLNNKVLIYRQTAATSALIEVANAVDLSAVTLVQGILIGRP